VINTKNKKNKKHVPAKVPGEMAKKVRSGMVSERKAGKRLLAHHTAPPPRARPTRPPMAPPVTVALPFVRVVGFS
jgi:hypothetical protein